MNSCDEIRPLLFALVEDEVTRAEKREIKRHVSRCATCRRELEEERALTRLLARPRRRRALLPAIGLAACALLAVLIFRPGPAHGSIEPRTLTPEMTLRDGQRTPLESSNHIEIPTGDSCRIRIRKVGTLSCEGPAMFELEQGNERWKLVLLRGAVRAEIEPDAELEFVSLFGRRILRSGPHFLCLRQAEDAPGGESATVTELMSQGHNAFFKEKDMVMAEAAYRAAWNHPAATEAQKARAHFYVAASLGRQHKLAEAVKVQAEWLKLYPTDKSYHHVLFFHGIYLWELGKEDEGRKCWRKIVRQAPDSQLGELASIKLRDGHATRRLAPKDPGYQPGRVVPAHAGKPGGYVVVAVALEERHASFQNVARKAAAHHKGRLVEFDGRDFDRLRGTLAEAAPQFVLFVVPPEFFDVNLHRSLLLLSAGLDGDIFPDYAFGYLTAKDGSGIAALWERTVATLREGLSSKTWIQTSVQGTGCYVTPGNVPAHARAAGYGGDSIHWGLHDSPAKLVDFVSANLPHLEKAGIITMTGCGDPQGTWLFDDHRNVESDKHWEFEAARVGQDPEGEMPRITADLIAELKLNRPIVFTGVCHAGATFRVFVEGDIVSTFGRTKGKATVYRLTPSESYCLAMIEAGAVAYVAPVGANHGASVAREVNFGLTHGASLGETIKSTYDELYLASRGNLILDLQVEGETRRSTEYVMQGGGANRMLIGDPALRPFARTVHPAESVEIRNRSEGGFEVVVTWGEGYRARAWDMYREDRNRDWSIQTRIDLDGLVPAGESRKISASVAAQGADGKPLPYVMIDAEPEVYHGRRFLHLQAASPRGPVAYKRVQAVFRVTMER